MELNKTSIEKIITSFITEFNKLSDENQIIIKPTETKIIAICEEDVSLNPDLALLHENKKFVFLDNGFENLSSRDKLMVIAASIKTHYQITEGFITGYGDILQYKLTSNSICNNEVFFGTDGKLMRDNSLN